MKYDQAGWMQKYTEKEALWIHGGNPSCPHARLTSGLHSNGFFNSRLVIPDDELMRCAASDLRELYLKHGGNISEADGIVGPQTGATKLAEFLSLEFSACPRPACFFASPEKHEEGGVKSMVFETADRSKLKNQHILLCEDVLTTGGSIGLTVNAIVESGGKVLPYILVLVNRSGLTEIDGRQIVALINHPMPMWNPEDCPLCKEGSEAIPPKGNWDKLTAVP